MFTESVEIYDLIYSEFKDYGSETSKVAALLEKECPQAHRILDVGCGAGRHASLLASDFGYEVDGLDIESGFLEIARRKSPDGEFFRGDMANFDLGRCYDAVLCLFSSIGYVRTVERLLSTARALRRHVASGGIAMIEPWFTPEAFKAGSFYLNTVDREEVKVCRVSRSEVRGRTSWLEFHYLVADSAGIQHMVEEHELGLFTEAEMMEALVRGGFDDVHFDPYGLTGRGLYLARRRN